jgi:hypothetical protein
MKIDFSYMELIAKLSAKTFDDTSLADLISAMDKSSIHTFGWPIAAVIHSHDGYPKPISNGIEARFSDVGRREYWTVKRNSEFYFIGELFENNRKGDQVFIDTRTNRITESFIRIASAYRILGATDEDRFAVIIKHGNILNKVLGAGNPSRIFPFERRCRINDVSSRFELSIREALEPESLKQRVHLAVRELGEMFDAFHPDKASFTDPIVDAFINGRIL